MGFNSAFKRLITLLETVILVCKLHDIECNATELTVIITINGIFYIINSGYIFRL